MDARAIEGNGSSEVVDSRGPRNWEQIKVPGLHPSMSMSDFMSHIGNCLSEQMISGNPPSADQQSEYQEILEDIAQYLLSDTQLTAADESHETSLMSRVNSLCCLLQKDPASLQSSQVDAEGTDGGRDDIQLNHAPGGISGAGMQAPEEDMKDATGGKKAPGMSRKDSFGELLYHLPRIASLPSLTKVLFNISEDCESQGR